LLPYDGDLLQYFRWIHRDFPLTRCERSCAHLQALVQGLAQDEMTRTRAAVTDTKWYQNLHVASREGPDASGEEREEAGASSEGGDSDATGWERISGQA